MIGLITTSYPRTSDDWAGAFVRDRVRTLSATTPVEVIAACAPLPPTSAAGGGREGGAAPREIDEPPIVRVPAPPGLFYDGGAPEALEAGGARALVAALGFTARLAGEVAARAARWEAVETHWLVPCGLVACAAAPGRPHTAFSHGGDVALLERLPLGAALARVLARSGASLVFASGDLRARFARLCALPVEALAATVEPAPFDAALFGRRPPGERGPLRRRLGCAGPLVLGVGRLVPVKGFTVLVRALARLPRATRPALVILGEGPERPALLARAARAGVELRLPGAVPRAAVADWLAAADLYVQPSVPLPSGRAEGMPVAVREALSVGVPVIASAVGGLTELRDRSLTLIPPGDPAALARAIAALL
jgi:glycosyltransferase involved in cell wall biosynthesis